jgi:hypothetical protein
MATKSKGGEVEISVLEITTQKVDYCIIGQTPIILNRMTEKVKNELLLPKGKKTTAEKATSLKHDPLQEFSDSPYKIADKDSPTLIAHLATAFKKAIANTAIDIPGAKKAQMGRLMWVEGEKIPIYGIPKLHMSVTRSADMNKTPDIRSRCIIPQWAARLTVVFTVPLLKEPVVSNLLAAAGQIQGVGDWRPEKGSGTFGQFRLVKPDDKEFVKILKEGDRKAQEKAMNNPESYDDETEELFSWFCDEAEKRGHKITRRAK